MKMYVISDNVDTQTGMRLAGVEGVVVHTQSEIREALESVVNDKNIEILLVTEKLAKNFSNEIAKIKLGMRLPLVVEIPDRHGTGRTPDSITSYVKEAIGVKV
ncbi:MAG: V-type ATP synthase subunit F [Bacillota bacterium]|nr:V-type ATP synthase subunit F [Bacillota bacterium]